MLLESGCGGDEMRCANGHAATFLFFKKGEKIHEVVGANPNAIKAAIDTKKA